MICPLSVFPSGSRKQTSLLVPSSARFLIRGMLKLFQNVIKFEVIVYTKPLLCSSISMHSFILFSSHTVFSLMCALYLPPPPPPPACDSGCKAETNGFAGTQRGCQLKLPGVIWVYAPRSAAFFLLHYILFRRLSLFFSSLFFLFLVGNQLLVPTRPRVKCLVMIILH